MDRTRTPAKHGEKPTIRDRPHEFCYEAVFWPGRKLVVSGEKGIGSWSDSTMRTPYTSPWATGLGPSVTVSRTPGFNRAATPGSFSGASNVSSTSQCENVWSTLAGSNRSTTLNAESGDSSAKCAVE